MYVLTSEVSPAVFCVGQPHTHKMLYTCQNALQVCLCLHHVGTEKCLCKHPVSVIYIPVVIPLHDTFFAYYTVAYYS